MSATRTAREKRNAYMRRRYWTDPIAQGRRKLRDQPGRYVEIRLQPRLAETMIERVPTDRSAAAWFYDWKALKDEGYCVTVLIAPDGKSLLGLAYRGPEGWLP